ncbi:MAG: HD domain-containing protein [Lachnospiraceae bacterium]|nr:HD domain-containing protein [Lachnospiraceae bacterium]
MTQPGCNVDEILAALERTGRFEAEKNCVQHASTSVYEHSVHVARVSLKLSRKLHLPVKERSLVRGALLHDYFLYDWHVPDPSHRLHGFIHAKIALKNARTDFSLNPTEENIILRHMFPLNPIPPTCLEGWVVCIADKYCAVEEVVRPRFRSSH